MNTIVVNVVKAVLNTKKRLNVKASIESGSEDEKEHFNFRTLKIGEEWRTSQLPRGNDVEVPETFTEAEKEL